MSFPFAISKFEATVGDFNTYCRVTLACEPLDDRPHDLPITNISIKQATDYAAWLSQVTGNHYQIPSVEQWRYAASANGDQPREDYNCLVKQNGETLKGGNAIETQSGKSNGWGLYNYIGNVQEFAVIGESTVALGGSFADHYSDCNSNLTREHSGEADEITGFRVIQRF